MAAVLRFQCAWRGIRRELCAHAGRQIWDQVEFTLVPGSVGLHPPDDILLKIRWFRLITEQQFVGAVDVFDASPKVIALGKTYRCLREVSVPYEPAREIPV